MLFITYWELNEGMSTAERLQVGQKLMSSGLFPPSDVNIIRWDGTPDGWGVLIAEADSVAAINNAISMWRAAGDGFFKMTKTAPAQPAQDALSQLGELLGKLSGA